MRLGLSSSWSRGVYGPLAEAIERLIDVAAASRIVANVTSGRRTHRQQLALYRRGQRGMNPYPVAPPGTSDHERGLAVDLWAGSSAATRLLGRTWRSWGNEWSERDEVHFGVG